MNSARNIKMSMVDGRFIHYVNYKVTEAILELVCLATLKIYKPLLYTSKWYRR
jgi:hypothetical protein